MSAVVGLGDRTVGAGGAPLGPALHALGLQVDPANVLRVRQVLLTEADRLTTGLVWHGPGAKVGPCGGDPVSQEAMVAFNHRIDGFLDEVRARIQGLRDAAEVLADNARRYGRTEAEITGSFTSRYSDDDVWATL